MVEHPEGLQGKTLVGTIYFQMVPGVLRWRDPTSGCDSLPEAVLNAELTWFWTFCILLSQSHAVLTFLLFYLLGN